MNKREENWNKKFNLLEEYYLINDVLPVAGEKYENVSLGDWLYRQKKLYKKNMLDYNRLSKLDDLCELWCCDRASQREDSIYNMIYNNTYTDEISLLDYTEDIEILSYCVDNYIYGCKELIEDRGIFIKNKLDIDLISLVYNIDKKYIYLLYELCGKSWRKSDDIYWVKAIFGADKDGTILEKIIDELIDVTCSDDDRAKDIIIERYMNNKTYKTIGDKYNISANRASQICNKTIRKLRYNFNEYWRSLYIDDEYYYTDDTKLIPSKCKYLTSKDICVLNSRGIYTFADLIYVLYYDDGICCFIYDCFDEDLQDRYYDEFVHYCFENNMISELRSVGESINIDELSFMFIKDKMYLVSYMFNTLQKPVYIMTLFNKYEDSSKIEQDNIINVYTKVKDDIYTIKYDYKWYHYIDNSIYTCKLETTNANDSFNKIIFINANDDYISIYDDNNILLDKISYK